MGDLDDIDDGEGKDLLKAEEDALLGNLSDDDGSPQEFDYDDIDFSEDDGSDDNDLLNDPTEEQLEAMLLADDELDSDDSDDLDGAPSAFAAAEEYAKLLEDDVEESVIEEFRTKHGKKKKTKNSNSNANSNSKVGKKRKFSGGKGNKAKRQRRK